MEQNARSYILHSKKHTSKINRQQTALGSFLIRLVLSSLLFLFYMVLITNPHLKQFKASARNLNRYITLDYTENLFDFIKDIPYTLTYEKTDA